MLHGKRILLIIGGGIAAVKCPELVRLLRAEGAAVTPVLTKAGTEFVTPIAISALAGEAAHSTLFDLTQEAEIGHIQLSRAADLVVVAPATADLMAKMAQGLAGDLASTLLLATDKKVLIAPSMNVRMWHHPATQRNLAQLRADGVLTVGPNEGDMACGEYGLGRMAEPAEIVTAIRAAMARGPLAGKHVLVTSGPTHEPIDPVRYIANRSSGAQGTALAAALRDLGAQVTFVTGPASVPPPEGVTVVRVDTAREMLGAVQTALPADAAVFAAAVADWHVANAADQKMKKDATGTAPRLDFAENPDILATVAQMEAGRPQLVVGFAAETENVQAHATAKRARKGCDWIVANDVSPESGVMGGADNTVTIIDDSGAEEWTQMPKPLVAARLAARIAATLTGKA
ncbi:bifunctional phosphopantothenoylcysteine decarboxylase/phosphopantothenate--cysteine ligase CoaBC [Rhodobacter sp. TJ_12]|uniref:bifunctional phosphopantothenoylcysteine decarboxylase/phosphopantothenate--cysteine ligase CoaBC n=1 Tax=Rhodobacter sp. TJ_12 TaxID=2029399 RepID=UPI001CBEC0F1|nr:bifunctional phosphopantothenoylcysteine decarboxylase/phosphopantothenate--cysteine ligase CoaBC [Rhodobacter sp. TJ_12]MBZ4022731.1 bifunctional phosphopantothenoylcysteine decarboxylase/phosphopantothenate--cysteine ligase CoaBC [Rhodobacter sp. TJ_12]